MLLVQFPFLPFNFVQEFLHHLCKLCEQQSQPGVGGERKGKVERNHEMEHSDRGQLSRDFPVDVF